MGVHMHTHIFPLHPHFFSAFSFTSKLQQSRALVLLFQPQSFTKLHLKSEFVAQTVGFACRELLLGFVHVPTQTGKCLEGSNNQVVPQAGA